MPLKIEILLPKKEKPCPIPASGRTSERPNVGGEDVTISVKMIGSKAGIRDNESAPCVFNNEETPSLVDQHARHQISPPTYRVECHRCLRSFLLSRGKTTSP